MPFIVIYMLKLVVYNKSYGQSKLTSKITRDRFHRSTYPGRGRLRALWALAFYTWLCARARTFLRILDQFPGAFIYLLFCVRFLVNFKSIRQNVLFALCKQWFIKRRPHYPNTITVVPKPLYKFALIQTYLQCQFQQNPSNRFLTGSKTSLKQFEYCV